jgi:hypothetical protein
MLHSQEMIIFVMTSHTGKKVTLDIKSDGSESRVHGYHHEEDRDHVRHLHSSAEVVFQ